MNDLDLCLEVVSRSRQPLRWKWAWPTSRDPTIFGVLSNISLKLPALETSNLVHCFVWAMPSRHTNKFPWKWAWSRSRDPYNFWQYSRLS